MYRITQGESKLRRFSIVGFVGIAVLVALFGTLLETAQAQTAVSRPAAPANATLTTLVSFNQVDGESALSTLAQGTDGNFYGTTNIGGLNFSGTVFSVTPQGTLTTLYNFSDALGNIDGISPYGGVILGTDGNFYGTTTAGNENEGTVFKITPEGSLTVLHSFYGTDGKDAAAALVQAAGGIFYGTTLEGGAYGSGTIFKITPEGTFTSLYSFCAQTGCPDGSLPFGSLIQGMDGNFYGTTEEGGANGVGTVFRITAQGALTTLYSFCSQTNCTDGSYPQGTLSQSANGNLYGTARYGGANGDGTVFVITLKGTLTTLHSFNGTDGSGPVAGVFLASDGDFYGTASNDGKNGNFGTIYRMSPAGKFATLVNFDGANGTWPYGGIIQGTDGSFYGETMFGGSGSSSGSGTVYSLNVGLTPFVETQITSGKVGTPVVILGTNLSAATGVTFNGTMTKFTIVSSSEILTKVPVGATSGPVVVTTPSGPLTSNRSFTVVQ
jgi:uncharacterized repeat protein (TIGR03803 family)